MQICFPYLCDTEGSVLNIGSIGGTTGQHSLGSYAVTKEAIRTITRVAAREWGPNKINVNVLCPVCYTDTMDQMMEKNGVPKDMRVAALGHVGFKGGVLGMGTSEDVAPVAAFLISDDARCVTGQTIHADGGQDIHA